MTHTPGFLRIQTSAWTEGFDGGPQTRGGWIEAVKTDKNKGTWHTDENGEKQLHPHEETITIIPYLTYDFRQPHISEEEMCANARRLVACWNACAGIPTEELEKATVKDMVERARRNPLGSVHEPS